MGLVVGVGQRGTAPRSTLSTNMTHEHIEKMKSAIESVENIPPYRKAELLDAYCRFARGSEFTVEEFGGRADSGK